MDPSALADAPEVVWVAPERDEAVKAVARLSVSVRRVERADVLGLSGELDVDSAPLLRSELTAVLAQAGKLLIVDCSQLRFCDSTGLNVLLSIRQQAESARVSMRLAALQPAVARMFKVTQAESVFPVHTTVEGALADP